MPISDSENLTSSNLIDSSEVLTRLLSSLTIGIWKFNFATQEFFLENSLLRIIGYEADQSQSQKIEEILNTVYPRDKKHFEFLKNTNSSSIPQKQSFQFRMLDHNNNWIWLQNHSEIISYTSKKEPEWLIGYVQDITKRKKNELLSLKYKELLYKTNEVAKIGTWEVDLINKTVYWSDVTKKIHEVEKDFIPNLEGGIEFYKKGENRDRITKLFSACVSEGIGFDDEFIIITQNGNEKWVRSIGIAVMEKGTCTNVYGVFHDIDEKKKALDQLKNTEEKFRKTFDFAGLGMAMVGMDTEWIRVNDRLCDMLGYTKEEFLQLKFPDFTHPDDLEKDKMLLNEALQGNLEDYTIEKRYIHKKGHIIWTILTVTLVRTEAGEPLHFVSQLNDISEIKKAEKKVKELLEITNDQNDRLLNFAHIVSHNLRSHSGNLTMLMDLISLDHPKTAELELYSLLRNAVNQLEETVLNLNEVAVLNTKTEQNLTLLNLSEYVNKAITSINSLVLENSVEITNKIDKQVQVLAIPAYLDSIILNFLTNAIKYQSLDRSPNIEVSARSEDDYIILSIQDNGLGIDLKAHGKKLFGMYKTFHRHEDSRGLGLFITKNQIESMGGKVEVQSEVGKGTTFNIYLPNEKN